MRKQTENKRLGIKSLKRIQEVAKWRFSPKRDFVVSNLYVCLPTVPLECLPLLLVAIFFVSCGFVRWINQQQQQNNGEEVTSTLGPKEQESDMEWEMRDIPLQRVNYKQRNGSYNY